MFIVLKLCHLAYVAVSLFSLLQMKPVDTRELSSLCLPVSTPLPFLSLQPSPLNSQGPRAGWSLWEPACTSCQDMDSVFHSVCPSLSGWDDVVYNIRSYIFCTTHSHYTALPVLFFARLFLNNISLWVFHSDFLMIVCLFFSLYDIFVIIQCSRFELNLFFLQYFSCCSQ